MGNSSDGGQGSWRGIVFVMIVVSVATAVLAGSTDAFESIWAITRHLEIWEADELLLALLIAPTAGLFMAMARIGQLSRRVAALESGKPVAAPRNMPGPRVSGAEAIVKCTYCAKYKSADEGWLDDEQYIAGRCNATVVAGVCPSCRKPSAR